MRMTAESSKVVRSRGMQMVAVALMTSLLKVLRRALSYDGGWSDDVFGGPGKRERFFR